MCIRDSLLAGEGWHKEHHRRATATYPYPDFSGTIIKLIGHPKAEYRAESTV